MLVTMPAGSVPVVVRPSSFTASLVVTVRGVVPVPNAGVATRDAAAVHGWRCPQNIATADPPVTHVAEATKANHLADSPSALSVAKTMPAIAQVYRIPITTTCLLERYCFA